MTGGTALNPIFDFTLTVPQFSQSGSYPINLTLIDNAFNTARFAPADLQARGFPSSIMVISKPDTTPPQLVSFSISPTTVDVSAGPATLTVHIVASDDLSGFGSGSTGNGSIDIRHTSGASPFGRGSLPMTGGTALNPIFDFTLTVPQFSQSGSYPINLTLIDNAFNTARFAPADLQARNFPSSITVTASPSLRLGTNSINFAYQSGDNLPQPQAVMVSSSAATAFTATATGGSWLSVSPANGTTPASLSVSVNPAGLNPGTYNGTITITAPGASNSPQTVAVSLTVTSAPTISVSPSLLNYSYQSGGNPPQVQVVSVSASAAATFTAVASGGSWLSVSPTSGTAPASLSVSVNPAGLNPGTYNGTITVSGANGATGSTTINVTLTVTAALPSIKSVTNAASYATGAVSPGEIVTIFGTAIGPAAGAYATTDPATGKLATTIGGVQVLFGGIAAPMIYASSTQVSAVAPYEMAPVASPSVWIKYAGQTSNGYQLTSAATAPGLFTQNSSGSGPGAILNQDNSLNGPGNPAAKGSIVQVYLTGEGQTSPQGVTGAVTTATLPPPQVTPAPLLPIGVLINGQPALYVYAGEAPGLVAGMMQLNMQIPSDALSGNLSITVSIGGNTSQSNVTVSVR
jgi:uncharacterized protein (TIGR03437 family)